MWLVYDIAMLTFIANVIVNHPNFDVRFSNRAVADHLDPRTASHSRRHRHHNPPPPPPHHHHHHHPPHPSGTCLRWPTRRTEHVFLFCWRNHWEHNLEKKTPPNNFNKQNKYDVIQYQLFIIMFKSICFFVMAV